MTLRFIKKWEFEAKSEENLASLKLKFLMVRRNKPIIERGENLIRESNSPLDNRLAICKASA